MKTNQFLFAALAAAFLSVANYATAQVTIGGGDPPKAGTVLDLNSTTKGGLLLSNVYLDKLTHIPANQLIGITAEQDANTDLAGTVVYNTNACLKLEVSQMNSIDMSGRGIYVWDGNKWNKIGKPEHSITFAPYNLGANPAYDTPKKQMAYLATNAFSTTDATVYGGFFQWGRPDIGHAVKIPDYLRYNGTDNAVSGPSATIPIDEKFYYTNNSDWYTGSNPAPNALWGNGKAIGHNFNSADGGAIAKTGGGYYQKPVKSQYDPCPDGWRVPTQDEWERLSDYGCGAPETAGGDFGTSVSGHTAIASGLTWIPVVCASGKCVPDNSWTANATSSGYAVYEASVWTEAKATGGVYAGLNDGNVSSIFATKSLHDVDAPEPLLFLPAGGYRHCLNGSILDVGKTGFYWHSTVNVYAAAISYNLVITTAASPYLGHGFSVRCVK
ncbi:MAG: fibrobacter succinogenes major paralogous domain-containing protein [Prevotellaceae bacterium]|jgi:hypothetical protein|nr:fibrobacter succinogenes major paralogous domain-containing protein [Prevotellaceae bacterium]